MLVLTRKVGERIFISDDIVLTVLDRSGGRVRFGIEAPENVIIMREELLPYLGRRKVVGNEANHSPNTGHATGSDRETSQATEHDRD